MKASMPLAEQIGPACGEPRYGNMLNLESGRRREQFKRQMLTVPFPRGATGVRPPSSRHLDEFDEVLRRVIGIGDEHEGKSDSMLIQKSLSALVGSLL